MKTVKYFVFLILVALAVNVSAQSINTGSNSSSNTQSSSSSTTNGNVKNNVNVISNGADQIHYTGSYGVSNVPNVVSPGLVSSFGSDSCLGSTSGGASVRGFGFGFGHTHPDEACQLQRAAVRIYQMADWHRARARDYWAFSAQFNSQGQEAAEVFRIKSYREALIADELAQGGINIECEVNKKVHDALVEAGVACPKFKK